MLFFTFLLALVAILVKASQEINSSANGAAYNLRNFKPNVPVATVTVKKAMVTVYQPNQVVVTVNREMPARSQVVVETAVVTETLKIKNPHPQQGNNGHPGL